MMSRFRLSLAQLPIARSYPDYRSASALISFYRTLYLMYSPVSAAIRGALRVGVLAVKYSMTGDQKNSYGVWRPCD